MKHTDSAIGFMVDTTVQEMMLRIRLSIFPWDHWPNPHGETGLTPMVWVAEVAALLKELGRQLDRLDKRGWITDDARMQIEHIRKRLDEVREEYGRGKGGD